MKLHYFLPLTLILLASGAHATTYECKDRNGHTRYTGSPGANCRAVDLGRVNTYSAAPAPSYTPPPTSSDIATESATPADNSSSTAEMRAAEERLAQAKRNLEEGKQVRYGNERNYTRYLERIQGLQDAVDAAQKNLDALKTP